jgi:DeoR/GlpR family transcriptional regulator of sugar metabolism
MLTEQRKRHILDRLARDGRIVAKSLSLDLALSEDTIRRDLRELAAEGLLLRVHGGALPASPTIASLDRRRAMSAEAKQRLGRAAAALVEPGMSVIIDGGTTNLALVNRLPLTLRATVVTHSPPIATALEFHENIEVIVIGGRLFRHSMVAVGTAATEAIQRLGADLCFLGVTGVHADEGLTTGDYEEAHIKRALMRRAAETVVLATSEKLGAVSPHAVAPLGDISCLVIAPDAPAAFAETLRERSIRCITA